MLLVRIKYAVKEWNMTSKHAYFWISSNAPAMTIPPYNSLPSEKVFAHGLAKGEGSTWEAFLDQYIPILYALVSRFSGSSDKEVLDTITVNVFVSLWENRDLFAREERWSLIIYRTLLQQVFS